MIGYYYCSLDTFLNILKNRCIYLSDPSKMNDGLEVKWYLQKLNEEKSTSRVSETIFDRMKARSGMDLCYSDLVQYIDDKGQKSIYVSCFSKHPDLLSQWRAYANDGQGVSIGIELDELVIADNIFLEEIIYCDTVIDEEKETDVEIVADIIGTVIREKGIIDKQEQIEVFMNELIPVLAKYKNSAFKEEAEIRLIYCENLLFEKIVDRYGAFEEKYRFVELTHDFRTLGSNNITEFVKLSFALENIKEIYVGPKCSLSENDVCNIFKTMFGYEVKVIKSKASYR